VNRTHVSRLVAGIAATLTALAQAHHSGAAYESTRTQSITGKVIEFNWVNPHSSFKLEVAGADGKGVIWAIEMNTPQNLVRSGWKRTSIKAGDMVTAVVRPMRNGSPAGFYVSIKLADGTMLDGPAEGQGAASPTPPAAP
jgi:hypothetical protein